MKVIRINLILCVVVFSMLYLGFVATSWANSDCPYCGISVPDLNRHIATRHPEDHQSNLEPFVTDSQHSSPHSSVVVVPVQGEAVNTIAPLSIASSPNVSTSNQGERSNTWWHRFKRFAVVTASYELIGGISMGVQRAVNAYLETQPMRLLSSTLFGYAGYLSGKGAVLAINNVHQTCRPGVDPLISRRTGEIIAKAFSVCTATIGAFLPEIVNLNNCRQTNLVRSNRGEYNNVAVLLNPEDDSYHCTASRIGEAPNGQQFFASASHCLRFSPVGENGLLLVDPLTGKGSTYNVLEAGDFLPCIRNSMCNPIVEEDFAVLAQSSTLVFGMQPMQLNSCLGGASVSYIGQSPRVDINETLTLYAGNGEDPVVRAINYTVFYSADNQITTGENVVGGNSGGGLLDQAGRQRGIVHGGGLHGWFSSPDPVRIYDSIRSYSGFSLGPSP